MRSDAITNDPTPRSRDIFSTLEESFTMDLCEKEENSLSTYPVIGDWILHDNGRYPRDASKTNFLLLSVYTHTYHEFFGERLPYFGKEIGHWSCPTIKLTYPWNGVTSTRWYPLNTDLFNVEAEEKSGGIHIYISGGWWKNRFPSFNGKYTSRPFVEHNVEEGGALRSFNIFRQQTARVHLVIKSVWSANIAASMHAACLHRVAGPATGGRRRGRKPFQPLCSTWLRNRFC